MSKELYIGLMSGTSIDGLDACLIDMQNGKPEVIDVDSCKWSEAEAKALHDLCQSSSDEIEKEGKACVFIAKKQAELVNHLLSKAELKNEDIIAIGTHGQTVRHRPKLRFSKQLDLGPLTAALTGIDTVVDFRAADLAAGGDGAPLTPAFHQMMLKHAYRDRYVLNLGGISNLTVIEKGGKVLAGFDCGPANTLLDLSCRVLFNEPYDKDAKIASTGRVRKDWLYELLTHPYLKRDFPKSSGREDFNENTVKKYLNLVKNQEASGADLLATLCEYSVKAVIDEIIKIKEHFKNLKEGDLILCGGGAYNPLIKQRFEEYCRNLNLNVMLSDEVGIHPVYMEAEAFAWFTYMCINGKPIDLTHSTGAKYPTILGCLCPAPNGNFVKSRLK